MKYKVGDKVKVRSDLKCEEYYGGITFNFEMNKFKGMLCICLTGCADSNSTETRDEIRYSCLVYCSSRL